jgi:cytochrome c6
MKSFFVIFIAICLSTNVMVSQPPAAAAGAPANSAGANTYKTACASCHGADGRGTPLGKSLQAPDLRSEQVQRQSVADLTGVITAGKNNMPPFGNRLTKDQIDAVTNYVRILGQSK